MVIVELWFFIRIRVYLQSNRKYRGHYINTRSSMYMAYGEIWTAALLLQHSAVLPMLLAADAAAVPFNVLVPRRSFELPQSSSHAHHHTYKTLLVERYM